MGCTPGFGFRRAPERDCEPEPGIELLGYELDLDREPAAEPSGA